jgi:MFS family permease
LPSFQVKLAEFMQYSLFGSILTIGAMVGAIVSGSLADYAGRRVVSFFNSMCISQNLTTININ